MFSELYALMGMMFLLIMIGFLLRKKGKITNEGKKSLVDILLYVILPCNIIKAFSVKFEGDFWAKFIELLIVAILIQVLCLIITKVCYRKMNPGEKEVYQYGTVCSNSGFMGNPLSEGVFGSTGLVYASIFLIPQRIVMWTAGVSYFQKGESKKEVYKKVLLNPCMIATYIGLLTMIFQIEYPQVISKTIESLSNCCTGLTMMYIGTILTEVDFTSLLNKKQIYFAFIRLIAIPVIVFAGCRLAKVDSLITGVCTLLSATPAGSTTSVLAAKYHADERAAARSVVFTTALSVVTIPIWSYLLLSQL